MTTLPAYVADDTTFQILNFDLWETDPAFRPMNDWCRDHGINPKVVAIEGPIVRRETEIFYLHGDVGEAALRERRTVPASAGPAPWPPEVSIGLPAGPNAKPPAWWRTAIGANAAEQAEFEHLGIEAAQVGLTPDQARSLFVMWARGDVKVPR